MHRLSLIFTALRASFWFLPYLIVAACAVAAVALTNLRPSTADLWMAAFPHLFSANVAGARDMLSTIAGSMVSVVGIVFSMTLVALALTSSQYSSRVLRTFMRSRLTQVAIGLFAGLFVYCLIVLRGVTGRDDELVVPVFAVSLAVVFAIAAVALLIYFIHHIALLIQAATILASVADETIETIEHMFPLGEHGAEGAHEESAGATDIPSGCGQRITAPRSGYLQSIDHAALLRFACKHDTLVRMELGVGQFVIAGAGLLTLGNGQLHARELEKALHSMIKISPYRTVEQDPSFGIRQIVDVALKALSPAMNDTTTAVMCIDYVGTILASLASRPFGSPCHRVDGSLRLVIVNTDFATLVHEAFDQIRRSASDNVAILLRIAGTIEMLGTLPVLPGRYAAFAEQLGLLDEMSELTVATAADRAAIQRRVGEVRRSLDDACAKAAAGTKPNTAKGRI